MKYDGYLIHVLPTQRCNLQCNYCYSNALLNNELEMTNEKYTDAVARVINALPITVVHIEGGEPLLYEGIYSLIKKVNCKEKIYLVTNGYLISENIVQDLMSNGLKNVIVSIDYAESDNSICRKSCVESLSLLKNLGLHTEISVTMTKDNLNEIESLFDIADKYAINRIRFGEIVRVGAAQKNEIIFLDSSDYEWLIPHFIDCSMRYSNIDSALSLNGNVFEECSELFKMKYKNIIERRTCNMADTMITIDDVGDIYTCCNLVGNERFRIGNIYEPLENILNVNRHKAIQSVEWKNCPVGRGYHLNIIGGIC